MHRAVAVVLLALASIVGSGPANGQLDESTAEVPAVVSRFLECLSVGDLECLMETYAEEPSIQTLERQISGLEAIREFLEPIASDFRASPTPISWRTETVAGDLVAVAWSASTATRYYEMGYNHFAIVDDKIARHSFEPGYIKYPNLSSSPEAFVDRDGTALFFANSGLNGQGLWRSDGTPEGTSLIKDLAPGQSYPDVSGWVAFRDQFYFCYCHDPSGYSTHCTDDSGLWQTDGTSEGTRQVKSLQAFCREDRTAAALDDVFVFTADDGRHGHELWRSDGTPEGTRLVKDIRPGAEGSGITEPFQAGDLIYFGADDGRGTRLWRSDGTAAGTVPLAKLRGGYKGRHWAFSEYEGDLLFTGDDGKRGGELWRSDGSPKGTRLVKDVRPGPKGSALFEITVLDGIGYFSATDGKEREVFRTDGTERGTYGINANPVGSSYPDNMALSGGRILLSASDERRGSELWAIEPDGRPRALADIFPGTKGSNPQLIIDLDGIALFAATDLEHGMELWRTDGTPGGTFLVKDLEPGPDSGRPREMTRVGDLVFFNSTDGERGFELWRSDGTREGTILVEDLNQRPEEYRRPEPDND